MIVWFVIGLICLVSGVAVGWLALVMQDPLMVALIKGGVGAVAVFVMSTFLVVALIEIGQWVVDQRDCGVEPLPMFGREYEA